MFCAKESLARKPTTVQLMQFPMNTSRFNLFSRLQHFIAIIAVSILAFAPTVRGQTYSSEYVSAAYELAVNDVSGIYFDFYGATAEAQISVDTNLLRLSFLSANAQSAPVTIQNHHDYNTGFGTQIRITSTITVNPIQFSSSTPLSANLVTNGGAIYRTTTSPNSLNQAIITGSYSVQGPTESVSSTFSNVVMFTYGPDANTLLDTSTYPDEVTLAFPDSSNG